ncbi:phage portal protein [Paenibacillus sp. KACC 21273]|uniref:phage portal protein n=1 Tax=Paenibacillus sp. KACC 21273 TaxID=3025665 RepID=UPI0023653A08|nr:phage portal protein [Paenibacillus sp. KACC 21273]WDF52323.1 phage portal protein [Paenibacillus sp. KACC 21273]
MKHINNPLSYTTDGIYLSYDSKDGLIQGFINDFGYGNEWFVEYCSDIHQQTRITDILDTKEYLSGQHAINTRPNEMFNGKVFVPRKIVLQYAKRLLEFSTAYLVGNKITLTGHEEVVSAIKEVYKNGYDKIDFDNVSNVNRYGNSYEYVYIKDGKITSKIFDPADSYPVFNSENEYIAFVEFYTVHNVSFYNIYYPERVEKHSNAGGSLLKTGTYSNLSGLPTIYKNDNPLDSNFGRSDLIDYKSILDSMEDLLSKSTDAFYKHIVGIPIVKGQQLTNAGLPTEIVGGGLVLDSDADFKFENNEFNHDAFETLYKHLMMSLLDISSTPGVVLGKTDISNLSEVSIKLLFSLSNLKAMISEKFIKESIKDRLYKIRTLLEYKGIKFTDEQFNTIDIVFQYAMPQSEKDVIDNLSKLKEMGAISIESILSQSPYTNDIVAEMARLSKENNKDTEDAYN